MKKIFILFCFFCFLLLGFNVYAEETNEEIKLNIDAGIKPGNPLYFIDRGWENFRLWLNSNDEKEVELLLKYAEERMSELNELDSEKLFDHGDKVYQDYALKLNKASLRVAKLKVEDEIDDDKIKQFKDKLGNIANIDAVLSSEKLEKISDEIKDEVGEVQISTYAISMTIDEDLSDVTILKDKGYDHGEILKLKAISEITNTPINELVFLDIYKTEDGKSKIDFGKFSSELQLTKDEVKRYFKDYSTQKDKMNDEKNEEKRQLIEEKRNEIKNQFKGKVDEVIVVRHEEFISKIETYYEQKVDTIQNLPTQGKNGLTEAEKQYVLQELEVLKNELLNEIIEKINENNIDPMELNMIQGEFNKRVNELIENVRNHNGNNQNNDQKGNNGQAPKENENEKDKEKNNEKSKN